MNTNPANALVCAVAALGVGLSFTTTLPTVEDPTMDLSGYPVERGAWEVEEMPARSVATFDTTNPSWPGDSAWEKAEGWGADALTSCFQEVDAGTRNINVHKVTSLDDSKGTAGTLDSAWNSFSDSAMDVVVFDTAGTITTNKTIQPTEDCWWIAGQTARGGIQIDYTGTGKIWLLENGRFQAIQYMRSTHTIDTTATQDNFGYSFRDPDGEGYLISNNSFRYWNDECMSAVTIDDAADTLRAGTFQWNSCYGAPSHKTVKGIIGGSVFGWTIHHDFQSTAGYRSPTNFDAGDSLEAVNNVTYNSTARHVKSAVGSTNDLVATYFISGPETSSDGRRNYWQFNSAGTDSSTTVFIDGNVMDSTGAGNDAGGILNDSTDAQWQFVCQTPGSCGHANVDSTVYRRYTRRATPPIPVTLQTAGAARTSMIGTSFSKANINVGAVRYLTCTTGWTRFVDAADSTAVRDAFDQTGTFQDTRAGYAGLPSMDPQPSCSDQDGDGLPDDYETSVMGASDSTGLPNDSVGPSGYTAIQLRLAGKGFDWTSGGGGGGGGGGAQTPTTTSPGTLYVYQLGYTALSYRDADADVTVDDTVPDTAAVALPAPFHVRRTGSKVRTMVCLSDSLPSGYSDSLRAVGPLQDSLDAWLQAGTLADTTAAKDTASFFSACDDVGVVYLPMPSRASD